MTATAEEDIAGAFEAALAQDAGVPAPPAEETIAAPPRKPEPDGQPAGKRARRPRKPAGDDAPRVAPPAPEPARSGGYAADLTDFGNNVWLGATMIRGGKILGVPVPDCRLFAAAWKDSLPGGVAAWSRAAEQNATVRGAVSKLGGEGGVSWVLGVGLWAAGLVGACTALKDAPAEVRAKVVEANDAQLGEFIAQQVAALGLDVPEAEEATAA